jgi:hypothetical protein
MSCTYTLFLSQMLIFLNVAFIVSLFQVQITDRLNTFWTRLFLSLLDIKNWRTIKFILFSLCNSPHAMHAARLHYFHKLKYNGFIMPRQDCICWVNFSFFLPPWCVFSIDMINLDRFLDWITSSPVNNLNK